MTKTLHFLFLALFLFVVHATPAQDRSFNEVELALQRLIQDPGLKHGQVAFIAVNLANGHMIAEHNPDRAMVPASIQKLFTTASALHNLGEVHRFETKIWHSGGVVDGVLHGNLLVRGGGDPTLQSRYFSSINHEAMIRQALINAGIKEIDGKVIMDVSMYAKHTTPDQWSWEDMGNYFGATPTAFMWQDNMITIQLRSGQIGSAVGLADVWPTDRSFRLELDITASEVNKDDAWFFSSPGSDVVYGKGSIPAHKDRFPVKISNPDPVFSFAQNLIRDAKLGNPEIFISHDAYDVAGMTLLSTIASPTLTEIITVTNQVSVNLFAEVLNIAQDKDERGKSVEGGLSTMSAFMKQHKVSTAGIRMLDGSGVSPSNRLTARAMTDLLMVMHQHPSSEAFRKSLAVGGESGTLQYYFKGDLAKGKVIGKSGTMSGVRNYAGYVQNKQNQPIAFCIMMNDYDEARKAEVMQKVEALMEAVIQH
jgi:D-alanyl-D-alanine carboxypeptidase/D-alanyl-D-alanine-endopeptidase (penicillin-binding protein 4)